MDAKLETFVDHVGGCGLFQVCLSTCLILICFTGVWGMMFMTFALYNPGWTCADLDSGQTSLLYLNGTNTFSSASTNTSTYNTSESNTSSVEDICLAASSCSNFRFDTESSTVLTEWNLICDRGWVIPVMVSVQMVGVTIGSVLGGQIGELCGRKVSVYLWVAIIGVTNVIAVFSVSWEMLTAVRFFLGIGVGGVVATSLAYPLEFANGKWRIIISSVPAWNIGSLTFGVCLYLLKDWRNVQIATAVMCALIFLTVFWVPESLRWLAVHGHTEKSMKVALQICKLNRKPKPSFSEIDFSGSEGCEEDKRPSLVMLFRRELLQKTILTCSCAFLIAVMYYTISFGIGSLFGNFYLNFILYAVFIVPVFPLTFILGNNLGRRKATVIFLIVAGIFSFSIAVVSMTMHSSTGAYVSTCLALATNAFLGLAWNVMVPFFIELFPTSVRTLSFGLSSAASRAGGIVAPYLIPRDSDHMYISFLVIGVMSVLCCLMTLALPETNKQPMSDVMKTVPSGVTINAQRNSEDCDESLL
ncbi:solute carrier family 22 member 15-like [Aplysia californica]|uniref:Solute carrier family 22 member 15-like n=1 Tax=Aplysia californica TaxID=6500 RepID=A0ABM0JB47_APLCA|nr:solute carrier family 22 member 15-like [Aplysia californica]